MKKMQATILVLVLLITSLVYAADKGKVAVAAEEKTVTAEVSGVAARCPYFLIFGGDGVLVEAVDNPYKAAKGGAGTSVVPFLAQKGVTFVVAGEFGRNMTQAMKAKGIESLEFHGSAEAALKKVLEGRQQESK
jgi:predicted Fe-Mo cluster-binding NifX family protein